MMDDDRFRLTQQSPPSSSLTILGPVRAKKILTNKNKLQQILVKNNFFSSSKLF
jgi:hypothetical protein